MRPSNSDLSKAVAGEVLAEVFSTLTALGHALSIEDMRTLMDRVEARLQKATAVKAGSGKEVRA